LILMLIPGFSMHHKYRGPGSKSRIDIVLRQSESIITRTVSNSSQEIVIDQKTLR
jgi:hypothetical protein